MRRLLDAYNVNSATYFVDGTCTEEGRIIISGESGFGIPIKSCLFHDVDINGLNIDIVVWQSDGTLVGTAKLICSTFIGDEYDATGFAQGSFYDFANCTLSAVYAELQLSYSNNTGHDSQWMLHAITNAAGETFQEGNVKVKIIVR